MTNGAYLHSLILGDPMNSCRKCPDAVARIQGGIEEPTVVRMRLVLSGEWLRVGCGEDFWTS